MNEGEGFREYVRRLRDRGFVDAGNNFPHFVPITGDYKKDPSGEWRYVPGIISLVKPSKNPLFQVDIWKSPGGFSVRAFDMRGKRISFSVVIFDSNGTPQNEEKALKLEALYERRER